jgi:hypothetical protein
MLEWKRQAEVEVEGGEGGVRPLEGAVGDRKRPQPRREPSAPDPELAEIRLFNDDFRAIVVLMAKGWDHAAGVATSASGKPELKLQTG